VSALVTESLDCKEGYGIVRCTLSAGADHVILGVCGVAEAYFKREDTLLESGAFLSYNKPMQKTRGSPTFAGLCGKHQRHAGSPRVIGL
jgi:hypothetical protein